MNLAAVTAKLASSLNPSTYGQSVTFSATVAPVSGSLTPTGTVTFTDGSATLAIVPLASGAASYTAVALTVGTHPIVAAYSGDTNFQPGTANLSQIVTLAAVTTRLCFQLESVGVRTARDLQRDRGPGVGVRDTYRVYYFHGWFCDARGCSVIQRCCILHRGRFDREYACHRVGI